MPASYATFLDLMQLPNLHLKRGCALLAAICAICGLGACSSSANQTAVTVGSHTITPAEVTHWISVLVGRGTNGKEVGPPPPVPPKYTACIAYQGAHQPSGHPIPSHAGLTATCKFEYRRFKLKVLYLLIPYYWVAGEAAELGLKLNRPEIMKQLDAYKNVLAANGGSFKRYLSYTRATFKDMLLSFELEQLNREIVAKIGGDDSTPSDKLALARFGRAFERKWRARTSCQHGYVVPICKQYKPPKTPPDLTPPAVPLASNAG